MRLILTGRKFGRWTVGDLDTERSGRSSYFWCTCECGTRRSVFGASMTTGVSKSCGCLRDERTADRNRRSAKHHESGATITPEYRIWKGMKDRCENDRSKDYMRYGGRGIRVCERWRHSYDEFLADMGRRPSQKHSIDRINVHLDYTPGNCRWATSVEQGNNKRNNVILTYLCESMTLSQWARRLDISFSLLHRRYKRGLPTSLVLAPVVKRRAA